MQYLPQLLYTNPPTTPAATAASTNDPETPLPSVPLEVDAVGCAVLEVVTLAVPILVVLPFGIELGADLETVLVTKIPPVTEGGADAAATSFAALAYSIKGGFIILCKEGGQLGNMRFAGKGGEGRGNGPVMKGKEGKILTPPFQTKNNKSDPSSSPSPKTYRSAFFYSYPAISPNPLRHLHPRSS
jgi:hypothetical protein